MSNEPEDFTVLSSNAPQVTSVVTQKFGDYLRNCRAEAGLSVEDLASRAHVRAQLIHNLENNEFGDIDHFFLRATLERIALALDTNSDELLAGLETELRAQGLDTQNGRHASGNVNRQTFTPEEMGQILPKGNATRLPALLVSILIVSILILLIVAAAYQKYRARQLALPETPIQLDLPDLLTPREAPLETLEIPSN